MPKVTFKFNKEKDLWNTWDTLNYESPWEKSTNKPIPILFEICKGKKFSECKAKLEENNKILYQSPLIKITARAFQEAWDSISKEYFERLERIMKLPPIKKEIAAYLINQYRCPYDPDEMWFMVSIFSSIPKAMQTSAHEIMHLYFHNSPYWHEAEKQIGKDKTADLKEALTVLLNLEFKDLWQVRDEGKGNENQQRLRGFIAEQWKSKRDFDILIKECINYLKKNESR